jgi:hypothetical protein
LTLPPFPGPIGRRMMRSNFPFGSDHSRTVLSSDAVAIRAQVASTPMRRIIAVCIPVSMRSTGVWSGQALTAASSAALGVPSIAPW